MKNLDMWRLYVPFYSYGKDPQGEGRYPTLKPTQPQSQNTGLDRATSLLIVQFNSLSVTTKLNVGHVYEAPRVCASIIALFRRCEAKDCTPFQNGIERSAP
jgi:hypothetical protein